VKEWDTFHSGTVPVAHIWYFRSLPNKIGYLLGLPSKKLDQIIYYERYVVIQPGIAKTNADGEILWLFWIFNRRRIFGYFG
jgi:DNA-directed RNA polymerase beta' subunit